MAVALLVGCTRVILGAAHPVTAGAEATHLQMADY